MFTWADMFEPFLDRDTDSFLVTALISSNIRSKMSTVEQVLFGRVLVGQIEMEVFILQYYYVK
jgi:hypothetical protein